ETRYRCKAQVLDIDTSKHWAYRACKQCSRAVAPNQDQYWCPAHYGVDETETQQCYRVRLTMLDDTGFATFVLIGKSADNIFPITAAQLARAYPAEELEYPPAINAIRGKTGTFEVRLSRNSRPGYSTEFQVSRVWEMDLARVTPPLPDVSNPSSSSAEPVFKSPQFPVWTPPQPPVVPASPDSSPPQSAVSTPFTNSLFGSSIPKRPRTASASAKAT
ncbi:hypothetical protein LINPERHAP1_LOCUS26541, partial [Linum perenne]